MKILVLNAGSSSLKYQVFDMSNQSVIAKGIVEKIGQKDSFLDYENNGEKSHVDQPIKNHREAIELMIEKGLPTPISQLQAIGHRVVHGGEYFHDAVLIDGMVIEKIKECSSLAPLHNPAELTGILACRELAPEIPQVAVFDTAFHQSMKPEHYLYALPYSYYEKYKIRRYGFHGTSHEFVYQRFVERRGKSRNIEEGLKVITCHIGNGASITAIQDGKVVETSMGMTPMEGVIMGTRSGDVDPGVITFLMRKENLNADQIEDVLNKKSGLLGVSGVSGDMRDILAGYKKQDPKCMMTLEMYINGIVKYIGSYVALMNGVDAIILTAGIMERSSVVRALLLEKLARLDIRLDKKQNEKIEEECIISTEDSKVLVMVIPTNEELMIAEEAHRIIGDR